MQGETCQGDKEPLGEGEPAHPNQQGTFGRAHDDRCLLQEPWRRCWDSSSKQIAGVDPEGEIPGQEGG